MRRLIRFSSLLLSSGLALAAGCSNSTMVSGGGDAGVADMAIAGGGDMAIAAPDMAMSAMVSGTRLTMTTNNVIFGVTSDDKNIIAAAKGLGLVYVPVAGGMPKSIDPMTANLQIHGNVVVTWDGVGAMSPVGTANAWSAATGMKQLSTTSVNGIADASPDGAYVYYTDNAASDASSADIFVAKVDGSNAKKIAAGVPIDTACAPYGRFAANGKLMLSYCTGNAPDGGAASATLALIDPGTGTPTPLATGMANWFQFDAAKTKIVTNDANGKLMVFSAGGGMGTAIDTGVTDVEAWFTPDGTRVVYLAGDKLKSSPVSNPAPTTLTSGIAHVQYSFITSASREFFPAISPDGKWVVVSKTYNMDQTGDLYLASTTAAGNPTTLIAEKTKGVIFGDAFTADSTRALYYGDAVVLSGALIGTFKSMPVAGGMAVDHAKQTWLSFAGATGSIAVYNDKYKGVPQTNGRADIRVIDTAKADPSKLIAAQAEADIFPTTKRDRVVFAVNTPMSAAGFYIAPLQ